MLLLGLQKILLVTRNVESHSWAWGRKYSRGVHLERKFLEFFAFKTAHSGVLYIFERRRGAQTSRGRGILPLTLSPFSSGLPMTDVSAVWTILHSYGDMASQKLDGRTHGRTHERSGNFILCAMQPTKTSCSTSSRT